jgi:hypothetical protein
VALRTTEARLSSRCGCCDEMIEPGDRIARLPEDDEFVHADCAVEEGHDVEDGD